MTHLVVMRVCTCTPPPSPPSKNPKAKARDPPSLTTLNSVTWVCGAAEFSLKQVQSEGGGRPCDHNIELLTHTRGPGMSRDFNAAEFWKWCE